MAAGDDLSLELCDRVVEREPPALVVRGDRGTTPPRPYRVGCRALDRVRSAGASRLAPALSSRSTERPERSRVPDCRKLGGVSDQDQPCPGADRQLLQDIDSSRVEAIAASSITTTALRGSP